MAPDFHYTQGEGVTRMAPDSHYTPGRGVKVGCGLGFTPMPNPGSARPAACRRCPSMARIRPVAPFFVGGCRVNKGLRHVGVVGARIFGGRLPAGFWV